MAASEIIKNLPSSEEMQKQCELYPDEDNLVEIDSQGNLHGSPLAVTLFKHFAKYRPELLADERSRPKVRVRDFRLKNK